MSRFQLSTNSAICNAVLLCLGTDGGSTSTTLAGAVVDCWLTSHHDAEVSGTGGGGGGLGGDGAGGSHENGVPAAGLGCVAGGMPGGFGRKVKAGWSGWN